MPKEKTSTQQFELMVTLLQEKPDIARNYTQRAPEDVAAFWDNLSEQLNKLGPRQRDSCGWKKVWSDLKSYIKKKLSANKKESSGTGVGPFKQKSFTPLEDAVIALVAIDSSVKGIGATCFGTGNIRESPSEPSTSNAAADYDSEDEDEENRTIGESRETPCRTTTRPRKVFSSIQLLKKQVENQEAFFQEIKSNVQEATKALKEATYSHQNSAVHLKRVYQVMENLCEVEKKNLKKRNTITLK